MGQVWLAEKRGAANFSKLVAIKMISTTKVGDQRVVRMLMDEARLVANLVHPNIIQVYQLARNRNEVFIVMEHVFGVSLLQIIERAKDLGENVPLDLVAFVFARICYGLAYAHNKHNRHGEHMRIVHRDICPTNILVSFRGIPKLTDFGVAKALTSDVDDEVHVAWGKYPYMAPEAVQRKGTDQRSDIYSLGLVMFETITGRMAHRVGRHASELRAVLEGRDDGRPRPAHAPLLRPRVSRADREEGDRAGPGRPLPGRDVAREGPRAVAAHVLPLPRRGAALGLPGGPVPAGAEAPVLVTRRSSQPENPLLSRTTAQRDFSSAHSCRDAFASRGARQEPCAPSLRVAIEPGDRLHAASVRKGCAETRGPHPTER